MTVLASVVIMLCGHQYLITPCFDCSSIKTDGDVAYLIPVKAKTTCSEDSNKGLIQIDSNENRKTQAKLLIHEIVHVAIDCDKRQMDQSEKIAETIADLMNSSMGGFVLENLK